jgi:hypothetical protein
MEDTTQERNSQEGSAEAAGASRMEYPIRALVRADADDYPVNGVHRGDVYGFRKDGRNPGYRARGRYEDVYFRADELIIDPTPEQIAEERAKAGLPAADRACATASAIGGMTRRGISARTAP